MKPTRHVKTCPTCGTAMDGRKQYCSEECRPACSFAECGRRSRGNSGLCEMHLMQRRRGGELKPSRWASEWVCVVCGKDVERGAGSRKHCSGRCQTLDSYHRGARPKSSTCELCGEEFSLVGQSGERIQRTDTKWCPDCGRYSRSTLRYKNYGVTPQRYSEALKSGCEICGAVVEVLHIDHDHNCCPPRSKGKTKTCGKCVRGFLCGPCNRSIGMMQDDPDRLMNAARYLTKTK